MTDILNKLKESNKKLFVGMAGPGTGKSHAFKTIIESNEYKGKKILILSFINKLVDDLSTEFEGFNNVKVSTLHSFAKQRLGEVDLDPNLDQVISEDCLLLKGSVINYEDKFYEDNLTEDEEKFYKERKNFYQYKKGLYSFNSVIYAINRFFGTDETKIPRYDLILIDEFQDFNKSEGKLIKLLNKKSNVILVGDDNQSLYYFKKAKPEQIRNLYNNTNTESFTLDYCYRCTEVIVDATNDLIINSKKKGYLKDNLVKNFFYPKQDENHKSKHEVSLRYPKIDFIPSVSGNLLIYKLSQSIKENIKESKKRILILVPNYLKQGIYDGLISEGFNIVDFSLFSDEKCNKQKHSYLIDALKILEKRKTDNYALRKILFLYINDDGIKELLHKDKGIWFCLTDAVKERVKSDIAIFKKTRTGKDSLSSDELKRVGEIFSLKNILSRLIKGFKPVMKNSIEIEMTTVMSSKGLSADLVYYVGIDDKNMFDKKTKDFTDQKLCEFLVGITRTKEKLTLISLEDKNPKILEFLDKKYINKLENAN